MHICNIFNAKFLRRFLICLSILTILPMLTSATTVELVKPNKLPTSLQEDEDTSFTLKIGDFGDTNNLSLDTSLVLSGNSPLYDFGELNQYINANRYQHNIVLNIPALKQEFLYVNISGKAPSGEENIKCSGSDIVITKFVDSKQKLYEIKSDDKLAGIESFDLDIKKKDAFEDVMGNIRRPELDPAKNDIRKLFDSGITTDASNIANDLKNILWPNNLELFGLVGITSDFMLDIIVGIIIVVCLIVGYILGSRGEEEEE